VSGCVLAGRGCLYTLCLSLTPRTYSSVRKLVKLSAVQFMLNNHTSEHFSFLGINSQSNLSDMRCRTTFYTALGRLLMVDLGEDEEQFSQFMLPLTAAFESMAQMFNTNNFNEQDAKDTMSPILGLCSQC
ncbi:hypothetical protein FKM82_020428, partial [Ascaphus truei]